MNKRAKKRYIPKNKQLRNLAYLAIIGVLWCSVMITSNPILIILAIATTFSFWPQGHYGIRGVK